MLSAADTEFTVGIAEQEQEQNDKEQYFAIVPENASDVSHMLNPLNIITITVYSG